ncbi:hypothetical protein [Paraburkholderia humisilvae]|uniref:Phage coat protein n=1 Tax=Paraburkholderia humisilvae TaxID=627669 RepID=A0A6J5EA04_9BURK|nr:hypothetical protein [Paraburkholderia humisilvae]CAB3762444.1 hypothetical protein LMG29542_04359 [Paraburkholderia humisilvae]
MKAKLLALKKLGARVGAAVVTGGVAVAANAQTSTAPDFSQITSSVDFSTVITAIMAVATVMVGVYVAWRGAKFALRAVRGL